MENIRDLFEGHWFLRRFYPDFRYFKIIERDFTSEGPEGIGNAAAGVFLIENAPKKEVENLTRRLGEILERESPETVALLAGWMKHLFRNERIGAELLQEAMNVKNDKEAKGMLVETMTELKQDWLEQGIRDTALNLLDIGVSVEQISRATGMTPNAVKALKER